MNNYLLISFIGLLLFTSIVFYCHFHEDKATPTILSTKYQGAVRPTDDETYFRDTGITRPLK